MKYSGKVAACLIAALCTVMANAQLTSAQGSLAVRSTTSTSANVYVITNPSSTTYEVDGYSAASDGTLTLLPGSPFWKSSNPLFAMALTSHWFFVSDAVYIYSFSVSPTGTLKQVSSVNAAQYYGFGGTTGLKLVFDHTGSTLYSLAADGSGDNEFQFFSKNSATGALTYFGSTDPGVAYGYLAFTGNNLYAYSGGCVQDSSVMAGVSRGSDGTLTRLNLNVPIPTYPNGNYCMQGPGAADPASNLALPLYLETNQPPAPPAWLAVYTADNSGNLTTNSTYQNMPTSEVGWLNDMKASPAGNLLAVAGASGLQMFFFNGSKQITPYTGFLAEHPITQISWDNHNHLYGISSSGRLYSFTVTTTGYHQDPGSPYTTTNPQAIAVLSR